VSDDAHTAMKFADNVRVVASNIALAPRDYQFLKFRDQVNGAFQI